MQFFLLIFTKPGRSLLGVPCSIYPRSDTRGGAGGHRQLHPLHTSLLSHISCIAPLAYLQRFSSSVQLTKRILAYKFTPLVVNNSRYNVTVTPNQGLNSSNYSEFKCRAGGATCANSPIFLHQEMGDVRVVPTQKRYVLCTHQRIEKANSAAEPPPFHRTVTRGESSIEPSAVWLQGYSCCETFFKSMALVSSLKRSILNRGTASAPEYIL